MSIRKIIKDVRNAMRDPERDFSERIFLYLTFDSVLLALIALIGDIVSGENWVEILVLALSLAAIPVIVVICLYKEKLKVAAVLIVIGLIFFLLPVLFFFGGGLQGGGFLWVIFVFIYAGLVLSGGLRIAAFVLLTGFSIAALLINYFHPELIYPHSRGMTFADVGISLLLIGTLGFTMTMLQRKLLIEENRRAKKEAERAEELTRSQNRFFSSMSHEIRTPINSILGLNELILRDMSASDEIVNDARGIQGAGKMLLSLINDILDFSKMEAGSMDIVPVDYRIGEMLSEVINMIWLKANEKGLKLDVSIDPDVPSVLYGDEVRIKQVIVNLLNNAVKYTAEGSVGLRIEIGEAGTDHVILRMSVTDTGIGIKKEALPYLFDAFRRVDQEKNRMIEGTGLGLSIVKQIVTLMGGTVTVNSVYGEGSTFTVMVRQGISDSTAVGELNIHNQHAVRVSAYEASFTAPEAAILIVDDNEMNLEVESKLLAGTGMQIDKALSGAEALELSLEHHYDVILMDHLMPEMDGIKCLEKLRKQAGGLNRTTPVIVLTANAGSENKELYNRAGFDGYVVKPVSGEVLEETLIKYIASDKIIRNGSMVGMHENIDATASYMGKAEVVVTTTSMCDLPEKVLKNLNIHVLPFRVRTGKGVFKDGVQMDAAELVRYMKQGGIASSVVPDEGTYADFFAANLKRAHHLIHIAITTSMSEDYHVASEAARSFENVTVINSECLSSATGLLVLIAHKLAQQSLSADEIIAELERVKKRLKCSFVIETTEFMARKGLVGRRIHKIAEALNLHPCLSFRDDTSHIDGIWLGSVKRAYRKYISKAIPVDMIPDSDVVFITYVGVSQEKLQWIKEEIRKRAYFERVIFHQASAAISSNCGPGTFGILYFSKSNKSYNIGSYFEDEDEEILREDEPEETADAEEKGPDARLTELPAAAEELKWYQRLEWIDGDAAMENNGSEETLRTVLKIFCDSYTDKAGELDGFYAAEDWESYTIKVHALKSSVRLIGARDLAEKAQLLENAGKEGNAEYIRNHHTALMEQYRKLGASVAAVFEEDSKEAPESDAKPVADAFLIQSVYEGLREAADAMSCDDIEEILEEITDYTIPDGEKQKLDEIRKRAGEYDYDGILELLDAQG